MNRVFYDKKWKKGEQLKLFLDVWEMADVKWIDQLDCTISWGRQKIEMPFSEFFDRLKESISQKKLVQWAFIKEDDMYIEPLNERSKSFSAFVRFDDLYTVDEESGIKRWRDLFGWAYIREEDAEKLIKKYGLCERKFGCK